MGACTNKSKLHKEKEEVKMRFLNRLVIYPFVGYRQSK